MKIFFAEKKKKVNQLWRLATQIEADLFLTNWS